MKSKKILIVYLGGFVNNPAPREYLFNKMINELIDEGREVKKTISDRDMKICKFEDGSTVEMCPSLVALKGKKVTHLFVEESILSLGNGMNYVKECLFPTVIPKGNYVSMDASADEWSRICTFSLNKGNGLTLKKLIDRQ